jgi:hypothetical protein
MICGSRCLPHVPPRVLPKFVDPPLSTPFSFIAATAAMFAVRLILGAKPDVTGHCRKRRS